MMEEEEGMATFVFVNAGLFRQFVREGSAAMDSGMVVVA